MKKLFFVRVITEKHDHINIVEAETVREALAIVEKDLEWWKESLEDAMVDVVPLDLVKDRPIKYGFTSTITRCEEREGHGQEI